MHCVTLFPTIFIDIHFLSVITQFVMKLLKLPEKVIAPDLSVEYIYALSCSSCSMSENTLRTDWRKLVLLTISSSNY